MVEQTMGVGEMNGLDVGFKRRCGGLHNPDHVVWSNLTTWSVQGGYVKVYPASCVLAMADRSEKEKKARTAKYRIASCISVTLMATLYKFGRFCGLDTIL